MKTSQLIPLDPQPWCKNPKGYQIHQRFLTEFVEYLEAQGIECELPPDREDWDRGIDLIVDGRVNLDIKGFSVIPGPKSYTWDSGYWTGKRRPLYNESLTDFFVHPFGFGGADEWIVAPASALQTSFHGLAPFYWKDRCVTADRFAHLIGL